LVALVALTLMWGLNWPVMKFSLRELTPIYFRGLTMSGGALLMFAWYSMRGIEMRLPREAWLPLAWLALPNIFGWHLFSILGVQALASGRAAILGFTMPIWTVLLSILFFGERLTRRVAFSAVCAAFAVALLLGHELASMAGNPLGVIWMQAAALSWALGTILMRRSPLTLPTSVITVWMMLASSIGFLLLAPAFEPWPSWNFSPLMWLALAWAVSVNYGISQIIWFGMARQLPPMASAFSIMAVPLIGVLSATFIVDEIPRWQDWAAVIFVTAAIASTLLPSRQETSS
jgi:drug/metabolite transporter (DMT)-like permease